MICYVDIYYLDLAYVMMMDADVNLSFLLPVLVLVLIAKPTLLLRYLHMSDEMEKTMHILCLFGYPFIRSLLAIRYNNLIHS